MVRGGREEHRLFREQFMIRPRILVDDEGEIGDRLEIYEPHSQGGNAYPYYMAPSVFLIDSKGNLSCFWILSGPRGRPSPECLLGILALAKDNDWSY